MPVGKITVKDDLSKATELSLELMGAPWDFPEEPLLQERADLTLLWGVKGQWTRRRSLRIAKAKYSYEGSGLDVTLTCRSKTHTLIRKTGDAWVNKTASEIVSTIAGRLGLKTRITPTTNRRTINQAYRSYVDLIMDLAEDEGYHFGIDEDGVVIFEPIGYDAPPSGRLEYGGRTPNLKSFQVTAKASYGEAASVKKEGINENTGKPEKSESKEARNPSKTKITSIRFLEGGGYQAREKVIEQPDMKASPEKKDITQKKADEENKRALWRTVEAHGVALNTEIVKGSNYHVIGIHPKHAGLYIATEVSYELGDSLIEVSFKMKKGGLNRGSVRHEKAENTVDHDSHVTANAPKKRTFTYLRGGGFKG
jgi:phage protein D